MKILGIGGMALPMSQTASFFYNPGRRVFKNKGIHLFSKHLQWLDYDGMAKAAREMGFDGVDLTVRPKGHVWPEKVEEDLPRAVEAIQKAGLKAELITTAITSAEEKYTEKIIKTASQLGIQYYRMGWLKYEDNEPIPEQLERFKTQFKALEEMNRHYNIHGAYQNHAGDSVGSPVWDIWYLIRDLDPQWLGCRFDVRHAMVEGMNSWTVGLRLLQPYIHSLDLKDFQWKKEEGRWKVETVPIGEGAVDFPAYFQLLVELKIEAPITLHVEYPLGGANDGATQITIPDEAVFEAISKDREKLETLMSVD
ncbi:MAG: sugar phosphate isomerase/epimerase [Lewinellaceae bacterium]|nr:sugar phosphate isomerase/epimerase [Phaeodactylibacter sp.]MCB9040511.1 sugar phosphate isomerase/epimerase [Lewinellaceae bacterium]